MEKELMLSIIRKHPLYFGLLCAIAGVTMMWLFLRALNPNPVGHLVAVALDSMTCTNTSTEEAYIAVSNSGEVRCFYKQPGVFGKITSGHLRYL
jgi:protein-S-isoprenylcysteine O-methyltransferase Ste14